MSNLNQKTILLVDDEMIIAMAGKKSLENHGYNVIIADSGESAFDLFIKNSDIDLILLDIDLGRGIDGPQTATEILRMREIPIVFLSSHTEPDIVEKTEKITSYGYVVKNSGITVLDASIKMAFKLFDAKRQIMESEVKQRAMISNISDVIGIIGPDGIIKYKSPNLAKWFGWFPEDIVGTDGREMVHPQDLNRIQRDFLNLLKKENTEKTTEYRFKCKDGSYKHVELTAINLVNDSIVNGVLLNYHDTSLRRQAEDKLNNMTRLYALLSQINQIIVRTGEQNELFSKICHAAVEFGQFRMAWIGLYDELNDIVKPLVSAGHEDGYLENIVIAANDNSHGKGPTGTALREGNIMIAQDIAVDPRMQPWRDEAVKRGYRSSAAVPFRCNGKLFGALNLYAEEPDFFKSDDRQLLEEIGEDLSFALNAMFKENERKNVEAKLRESEDRYRSLVENANDVVFRTDTAGRFTFVNPAGLRVTGRSEEEVLGSHFSKLIREDRRGDTIRFLVNQFDNMIMNTYYEFPVINKQNEEIWLGQNSQLIFKDGIITGFQAVARDITDLKKVESALRENQEYLNAVIDSVSDAIFVDDADTGEIIDVNRSMCEMYGYSREEAIRTPIGDLSQGEPPYSQVEALEWLRKAREIGPQTFEWLGKRRNGELFDVEISIRFTVIGGKNRFVVAGHEISERKKAENQIRNLLAEKDLLLKEVHHRIKNNMSTINSLLYLHAETLKDITAVRALHDAGSRVQSMMLLYDKIYHSADFMEISVRSYFPSLVEKIVSNFPHGNKVKIINSIDDFILDTNRLQPLGIIINELLTNIMKYAFPEREDCEIRFSVLLNDSKVSIIIQDNGTGIPETIDFKNSAGFGLMLVSMLTRQLKGDIRIERDNGTRFVMEFDL